MIQTIVNQDPEIIALVAFSLGIWMPDKYSNQCVKPLAEIIVRTATGREPGKEIPVEDESEDT